MNNQSETNDLQRILDILKEKKGWYSLLILLLVGTVGSYVSFFVTPIYEKNSQILVNQADMGTNVNIQEIQADVQMVNTYREIIKSPRILEQVALKIGEGYTADILQENLKVSNSSDSQVIDLTVLDADPVIAATIVNELAQMIQSEMPKIMQVENVTILSTASVTGLEKPVKPNKLFMIVLAFLFSLLAILANIFFELTFRKKITTVDDIQTHLGIDVLGEFSYFSGEHLLVAVEKIEKKRRIQRTRRER